MTTINSSGNFETTQGIVWDLTIDGNGTSTPVEVTFDPSQGDGVNTDINIGTMTINGGSIVNMYTNVNNISISSINLNGGTLVIDPAIVDGASNAALTINVGDAGGKLLIAQTADTSATIPIVFKNGIPGNFVSGFIGATSVTAQYLPALGGTILTANDGRTVIGAGNPYNLPADGSPETYTKVGPDGVILACFLAGTMIATPEGARAIEQIIVGDTVLAQVEGQWVSRKVVALKAAHVCAVGVPSDMSGHPVRIQRGAVAPSVPDRDLLVTSEHCFLFEGKFVPVRMLVNGSTIRYDGDITSYTHYHIELDHHSVIVANNMLTESFLDTHSRISSSEAGHNVVCLRPQYLSWEKHAAAPLGTDQGFVEAIFRKICERLPAAESEAVEASAALSGLWLETEAGERFVPCRQVGGRTVFIVPAHVHQLYLCSSAVRPCDVIGPYVDDRRTLGALVKSIHVFGDHVAQRKLLGPSELCGDGWLEDGHLLSWTNGRAYLDVGADMSKHSYVLSVDATTLQEMAALEQANAA
ncbi:Hint domain-containing protein [Neokomagataea anthophila]|uniref:Hint domain-containing protein n=1 Tax=Neokomagataea anthophila TaxID=2826925 RepID=A0ABS5E5P5_9PROT|nr:Hint domain-containing protein [Neokomagataea anthophila]MBR0559228.1 Hint domain-containing protein [Neokomagataea anthophila]